MALSSGDISSTPRLLAFRSNVGRISVAEEDRPDDEIQELVRMTISEHFREYLCEFQDILFFI